ncbi:MAG: DUF1810 domain-containing protein [Methylobacter sp.]
MVSGDAYNLSRFTEAQQNSYRNALVELQAGRKQSHWMWFIFPQIDGLGHSATAKYYAIKSREEARQYLNHPVLGHRLLECVTALLSLEGRPAAEIFGYPDDLKLKSSMTLFAAVASEPLFAEVLDKYYNGQRDMATLQLLEKLKD